MKVKYNLLLLLYISQVALGELIQLSENENAHNKNTMHSCGDLEETVFIERSCPETESSQQLRKLTKQASSDAKLEKKVTFARLLSKMSAEINNSSEIDVS